MIKKETLSQIILDFQDQNLPDLIERELEIDLEVPLKRATVILGPRRSGKTYYLYFLIKKLLKQDIERRRILYVDFEDPRLFGATLEDLIAFTEVFYELYPQNKSQKVWFFFDEIQNIENWERFIRNILDKEKAQVFLSGSSSKLLSTEIATSLRGRTLNYLLLPFSFSEFLKARNITYKRYLSSKEKAKLINAFWEYFSFGGYPETVIYPKERKKIIQEIIQVTIYRDLIGRYKIRNTKVVKLMFNYLAGAKEFSVHKFYNFLKSLNVKISKNSLYNYLEFFNDAFIFFPLRRFSPSVKNVEQSLPKIYTVDNALIEAIIADNKGKKLENMVFISLLRGGLQLNKDIFYFALNGNEIDFAIKKDRKILTLLQSCYDINNFDTREREVKSLIKASEKLGCNNLLVITSDFESEEKIAGRKIRFVPVWKWLSIYKRSM